MSTSEPGNIHDAFDDDSENIGMLDEQPVQLDEEFVTQARQAHRAEQGAAMLDELRQNLPTIQGGAADGAPVLPPDMTLMMAFTTLDGMSYIQIPDQARMSVPVAAKNLRYLADLLEGKPVTPVCIRCAGDIPVPGRCPNCNADPKVVVDPLDFGDEQPPAPMEPCS